MDKLQFLKECIKEKVIINFFYSNKWSNYQSIRLVSPVAVGILEKSGNLALRGYINNSNSYSLLEGITQKRWRIYLISRIRDLERTNFKFTKPDGYRRGDRSMRSINFQLSKVRIWDEEFDDFFVPIKNIFEYEV